MSLPNSTLGFLALWLIPGLGPRRISKLINNFENIESIFESSPQNLTRLLGMDSKISKLIPQARDSQIFKEELRLIKKYNLQVLDITQKKYPSLLREIYDAPPILYVRGDIDFNQGIPIALVGSRKSSYSGKSMCQKLINQLAGLNANIVIVSGLALGIDCTAHKAALDAGLKTVSVLAGGLSNIYPAQNKNLSEKIVQNGALITEFPVNTRPVALNFPLRNRIISGISKGVVVVEAGERSGASITAGCALEQNRELFALPGPAESSYYRGTNRMIQKGQAKLVMDAHDILEEIIPDMISYLETKPSSNQKKAKIELSRDEKAILNILEEGCLHQNSLAQELNMPVHQLLASLTTLEIKGLIVCKSGSIYQALAT